MSAWPGKYVIGLTGNIATGKSEVRRILEKFGAFGIDADQLAHQVIAKGEPAYERIVETFGTKILAENSQIDRARLGQIVFGDRTALAMLEAIVHPQVRKIVDHQVRHAGQAVVVIEAIKLIESGYPKLCDSIWVTYSPEQIQLKRLMEQRGMTETLARQRVSAQPDQEEKINAANVVIYNEGSLDDLRQQVLSYWQKIFASS